MSPVLPAIALLEIILPDKGGSQPGFGMRSCMDSLVYKPQTYPQQATGITAEAAAIACRNSTSTSPQVIDALRSCIDGLMYKPRTYPQQATGITAEAAAIACRNPAPNPTHTSPQPGGILTASLR